MLTALGPCECCGAETHAPCVRLRIRNQALTEELAALRLELDRMRSRPPPCDMCRQRIERIRWDCETCNPSPVLADYPDATPTEK
jgi:hypothetical protein